ncbi:YqhG family protein [Paenibacillus tyrfis]|nr:YqhG family protein [Paenibacillus tyrfis]
MTADQIRSFVQRYLEAEQCDIMEKHPAYVTVKLSPSADKDLNHRPYYWSFVERTGVTPETMTCTFVFDPEAYRELQPHGPPGGPQPGVSTAAPGLAGTTGTSAAGATAGQPSAGSPAGAAAQTGAAPGGAQPQGDSILGRYFGFVPTSFTARIPRDEVTYGSRRLEQLFAAVRAKGKYVRLFEQHVPEQPRRSATVPYDTWLAVNYKVELACDMKRSEIHSLAIQLQTGVIRERFMDWIAPLAFTPQLPAHVYITPDRIALPRAVLYLEEHLESKLARYDHRWAKEAQLRLADEQARIRDYYEALLKTAELDQRPDIEAQYAGRSREIEWQYRPRIRISAINCGLFHVSSAKPPAY